MPTDLQAINRLLPQTQCRECGYQGCLPYAQALLHEDAPVNLCAPGGEAVMVDIAALLGKPRVAPVKIQPKAVALIDEAACIGCTACIRACPVDAIMGASKFMHTVISDECTGCGLCLPPCPVDCIEMIPSEQEYLPAARSLSRSSEARFAAAEHAQSRFDWHTERKARDEAERKAMLAEREAAVKAKQAQIQAETQAASKPAFNPMDLIAKAMAKAQSQQDKLVASDNREAFKNRQIEEAKERAELRRAQRDVKYGNEEEKAAALAYLRRYKAEQEAAKEIR